MKAKKIILEDFDYIVASLPKETAKICLRQLREKECFAYADRASWFASLTEEQKEEVQQWRKEWCDVTETFIKPIRPYWLKY